MRGPALALSLLLALVALVPASDAALTKALPFETTAPFMGDLSTAGSMTITSGALRVQAPSVQGSLGLIGVQAFSLRGLSEACWQESTGAPVCNPGQFTLDVAGDSSVGICFPSALSATFQADHTLALFVDFAEDEDLNTLPVNRSLVAPSVGGELLLSSIAPIADAALSPNPCSSSGAIVALDANTTMTLRDGGTVAKQFVGKNGRFVFAGTPIASPIQADLLVLPFGPSASAQFTRATRAAADEGLNGDRLNELILLLDESHANSNTQRNNTFADSINDLPEAIKRLLNGAFLQIPAQVEGSNPDPADLTFARFTHFKATASGSVIHYEGGALLAAADGHIAHDHKLIGIKIVALPILGIVLWLLAIGVFVTRVVLHPEKHSRWDALRWIGWIATPMSILLVFFLVDLEVRHMLGASFLSGTEGKARAIYFLLEFGFMGILGLVAGGPLRILLRNSFLLARQGTFMGLAGSIATLLSYFLAVTYFRDYLDLVFSQVVSKLA